MGCYYSLDYDDYYIAEELVADFERSLAVNNISLGVIDIEVSSLNKGLYLSIKELNLLCSRVHIEKISNDYLVLLRLINSRTLSCLKLMTFSALFSFNTKLEKISTLFSYYDVDKKKKLYKNDVKSLIVNIFDISVNDTVICASSSKEAYEEKLIFDYNIFLQENKEYAISFLLEYLTYNKNYLTFEDFSKFLRRPEMECLFNAGLLRKFCFIINSKIKAKVKECVETKDKHLFKKISKKIIKSNNKVK